MIAVYSRSRNCRPAASSRKVLLTFTATFAPSEILVARYTTAFSDSPIFILMM